MSTRPSTRELLRDVASFIGGWSLILKQAGIFFDPPAQPSEILIGVGALIIGVPGFAQLWAARTGGSTSTGNSPLPPPAPESSPSSPGAS